MRFCLAMAAAALSAVAAHAVAQPVQTSSGVRAGDRSGASDSIVVDSAAGAVERSPARRADRIPGTNLPRMSNQTFGALLVLGIWGNTVLPITRDPNPRSDEWHTLDKPVHAFSAFALAETGLYAGVHPAFAVVSVCAGGAAFEVTQGYVSRKDIVANCAGAASAWILTSIATRLGGGIHPREER
jgi:hypothetical protein